MKYLPVIRKICQLSVLALFCALPFLAAIDFSFVKGSLFSLDIFGVPFADPSSTLQTAGQAAASGVFPAISIFIGAGLSLLLAFFLGRVFCGWICPYGLVSGLVARKGKVLKGAKRVRIIVFLVALALAALLGYPLITLLSMPGQITLAPILFGDDWQLALFVLLPPFLALIIDLLTGGRFFCSTLCPQAVLLGAAAWALPKKAPGMRIVWDKNKCRCKGAPCEKACQFGLRPRGKLKRDECVMCGDCVAVCAKKGGALKFAGKE
ncbi:MAG: 4Fe-4S binding protein [Desulfovibrio sp.]|nr:4Fe-4S binding protein [Desulfovibrio sp.]